MRKNINLTIYYYKTMTGWKAFYWGACQMFGFMQSEEEKVINLPSLPDYSIGTPLEVEQKSPAKSDNKGRETVITKIVQSKKKVTIFFQKRKDIAGYELAYRQGTKGKYKKMIVPSCQGNQVVLRKLKPGKNYYVKVRTFVLRVVRNAILLILKLRNFAGKVIRLFLFSIFEIFCILFVYVNH